MIVDTWPTRDAMVLVITPPGACAECEETKSIFVNRGGRTFCFECDRAHQRVTRNSELAMSPEAPCTARRAATA